MKTCLSFEDIVTVGQPRITELQRVGDSFPDAFSPGALLAFSRQVKNVEAAVVQTYAIAATAAKKADTHDEVADIWKLMGQLCESALQALSGLMNKYPECGTSQLYDLVLDYKLACDERQRGALEEKTCLTMEFPKGLLPDPI